MTLLFDSGDINLLQSNFRDLCLFHLESDFLQCIDIEGTFPKLGNLEFAVGLDGLLVLDRLDINLLEPHGRDPGFFGLVYLLFDSINADLFQTGHWEFGGFLISFCCGIRRLFLNGRNVYLAKHHVGCCRSSLLLLLSFSYHRGTAHWLFDWGYHTL